MSEPRLYFCLARECICVCESVSELCECVRESVSESWKRVRESECLYRDRFSLSSLPLSCLPCRLSQRWVYPCFVHIYTRLVSLSFASLRINGLGSFQWFRLVFDRPLVVSRSLSLVSLVVPLSSFLPRRIVSSCPIDSV